MATAKKLGEVAWLHPEAKGEGPSPRSGHSITCIDGKAIIFGGCGVSKDGLSQQIFQETWTLHIGDGENPKWELTDVMGDLPPPRWRHTVTVLPDGADTGQPGKALLLFGGLHKGARYNDTYVYSVDQKEWNIKECQGAPPHPRSHHTANLISQLIPGVEEDSPPVEKQRVCIVGGYGGPGTTRDFFMDISLLDIDEWTWYKVANTRGPQPKPRSDHCACYTRGMLIISGGRGWAQGKTDLGFYDDIHCLDIQKSARQGHDRTPRARKRGSPSSRDAPRRPPLAPPRRRPSHIASSPPCPSVAAHEQMSGSCRPSTTRRTRSPSGGPSCRARCGTIWPCASSRCRTTGCSSSVARRTLASSPMPST